MFGGALLTIAHITVSSQKDNFQKKNFDLHLKKHPLRHLTLKIQAPSVLQLGHELRGLPADEIPRCN